MHKSKSNNYNSRFRDIISDPVNFLIHRTPTAGLIEGDFVHLHNGIKVPYGGKLSYYSDFSKILILNRGVHEPLEEFTFQQLLKKLPKNSNMIELGSYWGHYSMWFKQKVKNSSVILVEADSRNMEVGKVNFQRIGFDGTFILDKVGIGGFTIDNYFKDNIKKLNVLHADIQGYEVEMLLGAEKTLKNKLIDYIFISTHSQKLHSQVLEILSNYGFEIEISSDFDNETTAEDGFILATNPICEKIIGSWKPLGRKEICDSTPSDILNFLSTTKKHFQL